MQLEDRDAIVFPHHPVGREEGAADRLRQIARCGRPVAGLFNHPGGDFGLETEQGRKFRHANLLACRFTWRSNASIERTVTPRNHPSVSKFDSKEAVERAQAGGHRMSQAVEKTARAAGGPWQDSAVRRHPESYSAAVSATPAA